MEIGFEELKKIEFQIPSKFADFCETHNLKYFLAYGTLLGAIRHNGFIPWDDDIDIFMPRDDYNKLIESFNSAEVENLFLVDPKTPLARHSFVKIIDTRTEKFEVGVDYSKGALGVDIDVFPLDGVPTDEKTYKKWFKKLFFIYRLFVFKNIDRKTTPSKKLKKALPFIQPFLNKKLLLNMADKLHKKYPFAECDMVDDAEHIFTLAKHKLYRSDFEEFIYHDFEGGKFRIPKNYDKILTATYGDYMTPPPKEKQITHHSNNCYWK